MPIDAKIWFLQEGEAAWLEVYNEKLQRRGNCHHAIRGKVNPGLYKMELRYGLGGLIAKNAQVGEDKPYEDQNNLMPVSALWPGLKENGKAVDDVHWRIIASDGRKYDRHYKKPAGKRSPEFKLFLPLKQGLSYRIEARKSKDGPVVASQKIEGLEDGWGVSVDLEVAGNK